jgi:hypothetical protein
MLLCLGFINHSTVHVKDLAEFSGVCLYHVCHKLSTGPCMLLHTVVLKSGKRGE